MEFTLNSICKEKIVIQNDLKVECSHNQDTKTGQVIKPVGRRMPTFVKESTQDFRLFG